MKLLIYCAIGVGLTIASQSLLAGVAIGTKPATISLSGELGGRVTGQPWSSAEIVDRVHVLFYVDPDEKEVNEPLEKALKTEEFPEDKFQSIAVINMDATWLPNVAIASKLEAKQKEFPRTVYVKDLKRELVKKWSLKDDAYDVVAFDKTGTVIFCHEGKVPDDEIKRLIQMIRAAL